MRVYRSEYGGFFRLWHGGPGISWTNRRPLFSERNGYTSPLFRAFGYRFFKVGRDRTSSKGPHEEGR